MSCSTPEAYVDTIERIKSGNCKATRDFTKISNALGAAQRANANFRAAVNGNFVFSLILCPMPWLYRWGDEDASLPPRILKMTEARLEADRRIKSLLLWSSSFLPLAE